MIFLLLLFLSLLLSFPFNASSKSKQNYKSFAFAQQRNKKGFPRSKTVIPAVKKSLNSFRRVFITTASLNNFPSLKSGRLQGKEVFVSEIRRLVRGHQDSAAISVLIKSMQNNEILFSHHMYHPLIPASTLKVLTGEAALLYLGALYRFPTQILTDAKEIKNGMLQGNLYIVLGGDPTLTYYDLADLLIALKSQDIHSISGNVYIDHFAYDHQFYGPGWESKDKTNCYAAPISASIINRNCLSFKVAPGQSPGRAAEIITSPKYYYPNIKNGVITKPQKTRACNLHLVKIPGNNLVLDGCMPKGQYAWGVTYVVSDITEYNRNLFKNLLSRLSIKVYGTVTFGTAESNLSLISQHASKPLRELISEMLKKSDNIIAGAIFKKIGQLYTQRPGSWENGSYAVSKILSEKAGMDIQGMRIIDGSGLSMQNLMSASQMMQILDFTYHHELTSYDFISALPIAGVDGTLKNRMQAAQRKVRAKTGTLSGSGVVSLAGYAVTAEKEPVAFVVMVNGNKGLSWRYRQFGDDVATAITRFSRSAPAIETAFSDF